MWDYPEHQIDFKIVHPTEESEEEAPPTKKTPAKATPAKAKAAPAKAEESDEDGKTSNTIKQHGVLCNIRLNFFTTTDFFQPRLIYPHALHFLAHMWLLSTHVWNVRRESEYNAMSSVPVCVIVCRFYPQSLWHSCLCLLLMKSNEVLPLKSGLKVEMLCIFVKVTNINVYCV